MPGVTHLEVTPEEAGQKLLQFLLRRLGRGVPRSAVQRWIRTGQVRVDKSRAKPYQRLDRGQVVRIPPHEPAQDAPEQSAPGAADAEPRPLGMPVVLSTEHLLVLAKPGGLCVHAGPKQNDSVAARLRAAYPNAPFGPTLAHRLDRDTSGLLLAATSYAALRALNERFAAGLVDKTYLAWVRGRMETPDGPVLLQDEMERTGAPGQERVTTGGGKPARALAAALVPGQSTTLLALRLLTGRTHQLRVQLAERGHAIVGDVKYGGQSAGALLLHCFRLALPPAPQDAHQAVRNEPAGLTGLELSLAPDHWQGRWAVDEALLQGAAGAF